MASATAAPAYFAHVDGLRAFAVAAVMVYHLDPRLLPGGFVGVDAFFVISGFVVTASLAGHRDETAGAFLGRFYARRLARLVPALVAMLIVTTALYVLFVPRAWFNRAAETVGQMAFWGASNWTLDREVVNYFEPRAEWNPFTHTWSLGVEEQFYLVAPLLLFVALGSRFGRQRRTLAVVGIAGLAAASFVACHYFGVTRGSRFVFYQLAFRFWELACGVLLFVVGRRIRRPSGIAARLYRLSGWGGLALVALATGAPRPEAYPWLRATVAVLGTMLLIGLPAVERRDRLHALLSSRPALWLGHRSYALYLWHWPVFVLARWTTGLNVWPFNAAAVFLSVAAAALSYRWIENPVRYSRVLKARPVAQRITMFMVVLGLGWWMGRTLLQMQPVLGLGQPVREAPDWYGDRGLLKTTLADARRCEPTVHRSGFGDLPQGLTAFVPDGCQPRASAQLFVLGDSHAVAYLPMLEQLSAEQGRTVKVLQAPGCAYIDMMAPMLPEADRRCFDLARAAMRTVLEQARPGDVVFLTSLRLPRLVQLGGEVRGAKAAPGHDVYARTADELRSIEMAAADAPRWFAPFLDAGLLVVFELPKPVLRSHPFQCVDWFNRGNPLCAAGSSERRENQERYRAPIVQALRRLAQTHAEVSLWDPLPELCDDERCSALAHGRPLFFDADHVSPYGNLVLVGSFASRIRALAP
jgi:peptidoglycan/LPS O-acetylase OafA/YrhL